MSGDISHFVTSSSFFESLKKKGRKMRFEGRCLVE